MHDLMGKQSVFCCFGWLAVFHFKSMHGEQIDFASQVFDGRLLS